MHCKEIVFGMKARRGFIGVLIVVIIILSVLVAAQVRKDLVVEELEKLIVRRTEGVSQVERKDSQETLELLWPKIEEKLNAEREGMTENAEEQ